MENLTSDWPSINIESVVTFNPEVLLISTPGLFQQLTSVQPPQPWREMSAVKSGRVYLLDGRLVRPGPRVMDDLVWLNSKLLRLGDDQ